MEMGYDYDEQNEKHQHHEAVDGLFNLFNKANNDLAMLHDRLDKEFKQIYPDNANPMKLVARIKKIQEEVSSLNEQCRELLAAKQDLIDKARVILVGNRSLLQRLQASTGVPVTDDSNDSAYTNFNQIIEEWTVQVRSRTGDEKQESGPEDINHLLFSAIVPGN
ncbi:unnamed protein product [Coffea canephora]|uniref:Protein FAM33A n=3 Tax=Coffea TaxID=13442 RepID=A0A068UHZ3_COFCA|nr:uncharacterized protein LOC113703361 isoform X2 [Coffea arabica]XP_027084245.1 uncharacterized protein LOC113706522 [Coffea arabica]CDP07912.1 unnamed protein product [Coffea canephora]